MPAKKAFYSAKDIMEVLGVGRNKAYEILHMFEKQGKALRSVKTIRVRVDYFDRWVFEQERRTMKAGA